jgi:hypothetical protein
MESKVPAVGHMMNMLLIYIGHALHSGELVTGRSVDHYPGPLFLVFGKSHIVILISGDSDLI